MICVSAKVQASDMRVISGHMCEKTFRVKYTHMSYVRTSAVQSSPSRGGATRAQQTKYRHC